MIGRKPLKRGPTSVSRLEKPAPRSHAADSCHAPGLGALPEVLGQRKVSLQLLVTGESRII
jgi:hypothetical protein